MDNGYEMSNQYKPRLIKLSNNTPFSCRFFCNNKLIATTNQQNEHTFTIPELPAHCKIEITPWKIKPLIRFDEQLVNYGLAGITPWDHMLEFKLDKNFLETYFQNIILAKKKYLERTGQDVPNDMENYVGINNEHKDIVEKIDRVVK
jgi:hypothetical protein